MRKYAFELEKLRNEICNVIVNFVQDYEFDGSHFLMLDENDCVFLSTYEDCDERVTNMAMDEDGDILFYDGDVMVGSYNSFGTDVLAEVADQILDGRCKYVDEEEM